jgi:hypothetical protein
MCAVPPISFRDQATPATGGKRGRTPRPVAALAVAVCLRPVKAANALLHHEIQHGEVEQREDNTQITTTPAIRPIFAAAEPVSAETMFALD